VGRRTVTSTWRRADRGGRDNAARVVLGRTRLLGLGLLLIRVVAQLLDALRLLPGLLLRLVEVDVSGGDLLRAELGARLLCAQHVRLAGAGRALLQCCGVCYTAGGRLGIGGVGSRKGRGSASDILPGTVGVTSLEEGRRGAANDRRSAGSGDGRGGFLDGRLVPGRKEVVIRLASRSGGSVSDLAIGNDNLARIPKGGQSSCRAKTNVGRAPNILLGVPSCPFLEFFLVLGCGVGLVLGLGVLAVQGGSPAVLLEELGGGLVSTNLHHAELVPLPFCSVISGGAGCVRFAGDTYGRGWLIGRRRYEHRGFDGWRNSQGRGRCLGVRMSMLGSFVHNRNRSGCAREVSMGGGRM